MKETTLSLGDVLSSQSQEQHMQVEISKQTIELMQETIAKIRSEKKYLAQSIYDFLGTEAEDTSVTAAQLIDTITRRIRTDICELKSEIDTLNKATSQAAIKSSSSGEVASLITELDQIMSEMDRHMKEKQLLLEKESSQKTTNMISSTIDLTAPISSCTAKERQLEESASFHKEAYHNNGFSFDAFNQGNNTDLPFGSTTNFTSNALLLDASQPSKSFEDSVLFENLSFDSVPVQGIPSVIEPDRKESDHWNAIDTFDAFPSAAIDSCTDHSSIETQLNDGKMVNMMLPSPRSNELITISSEDNSTFTPVPHDKIHPVFVDESNPPTNTFDDGFGGFADFSSAFKEDSSTTVFEADFKAFANESSEKDLKMDFDAFKFD